MNRSLIPIITFFCLMSTAIEETAAQSAVSVKPPVAKKQPKTTEIHGETLVDNYFWLREKSNPEVINYLNAENAFTDAVMQPTKPLQESLYTEMLGRIKETDLSVPYKLGDFFYYTRTEQGLQYPIHCRKRGSLEAKEEITLDVNRLAKGKAFTAVASYQISDDGNLLAYSVDTTGFRQYSLFIINLTTGELLPDRFGAVTSVVWAADNQTLFYGVEDEAKRPYKLYRRKLGTAKDEVVYEEKDELFRISAYRTRDKKMMLIASGSFETSEARYVMSDRPADAPKLILPRETDHEYFADHCDGVFYIRTNKGGKNFRLVTASVSEPSSWKEVMPHRTDVILEDIDLFAGHAVLTEREKGLTQFRLIDLKAGDFKTGAAHTIAFPEPAYSAFGAANPEFNTDLFRFNYQSLVTPNTVYDYDVKTREKKLLKQQEVLGGYDPSQYASERVMATASDGTEIPISIVYKKTTKRDGSAPMLLGGYGSYGYPNSAYFGSTNLSLLNRGITVAIAHIRGGGEMGEAWHDDGKMMKKKNTFTDFIAAAEYLVKEKYTSSDRLIIEGGSAGGLLIGAVVNMRPDLCKAAHLAVPFVDVMNTMLDASLPLTIQEYLEWGNPNKKAEYDYMKSYCPYTNLAAKNYPNLLITTSLNDSQVMYWEPAKYTAKLRTLKTDKNALLFKCNMAAGHGGASGRYDALRERAFEVAFFLTQLGLVKL